MAPQEVGKASRETIRALPHSQAHQPASNPAIGDDLGNDGSQPPGRIVIFDGHDVVEAQEPAPKVVDRRGVQGRYNRESRVDSELSQRIRGRERFRSETPRDEDQDVRTLAQDLRPAEGEPSIEVLNRQSVVFTQTVVERPRSIPGGSRRPGRPAIETLERRAAGSAA